MTKPDFAVIFDMDGVLIDSVDAVHKSRATLLDEYGVDLAVIKDPHGEGHKGGTVHDLLRAIKEQSGIDINPKTFSKRVVKSLLDDLRASGAKMEPGAMTLLDELRGHHIPMAIATSALNPSAYGKLDILGIADYFKAVITADDVSKHKPDPEVYLTAAQKLGIDKTRCVVFEDSVAGVTAGKAAGMKVIGFTKHSTDKNNLARADIVVDDWTELDFGLLRQFIS